MSENVVINDTTYNDVDTVALVRADGTVAKFYPDAVRYNEQTLTDKQKEQARTNIGVVGTGKDGISPTVTATDFSDSTGSGTSLEIRNADGTNYIIKIYNGKNGTNGTPGTAGAPGKNGTSVTVSSVVESTEDGGSNVVNFSDGKTLIVKNGKAGSDGKDYVLTDDDMAEIVAMVIESLGGNPVWGYVDSETMTIVLENAPDGEYSLAYVNEDGTISAPIGSMVKDTNTYYSVTNNLTNCVTSNTATQAIGGQSYSATITAKSGYELKTVTVTMDGNPVTVSGGNISIANVTGNIVITAVAEEKQAAEPTNFADPSSNDWENKSRISNSSSTGVSPADYEHMYVTNYIPVQAGDIITLGNCDTYSSTIPNARFAAYSGTSHSTRLYNDTYKTANNYMTWTADNNFTVTGSDVKYVRFTIFNVTDVNAVTINIQRNGEYL